MFPGVNHTEPAQLANVMTSWRLRETLDLSLNGEICVSKTHTSNFYEQWRYFYNQILRLFSSSGCCPIIRLTLAQSSAVFKAGFYLAGTHLSRARDWMRSSLRGGRSYRAGKEGETLEGGGRGVCHTERTEESPSESERQPVHPLTIRSSPTKTTRFTLSLRSPPNQLGGEASQHPERRRKRVRPPADARIFRLL